MAQSESPTEIINRFYQGLQSLSALKDMSTTNASNIECAINSCAQGGDVCEIKAAISVSREIDVLQGNGTTGRIDLGPYLFCFQEFAKDNNAKLTFQPPKEIATIKGVDETPVYRCFAVNKTYTWDGSKSKQLTDTLWIKTKINRISGIRNEYGGSRMISTQNMTTVGGLNSFSIADMEIQASTFYEKGNHEGALKLYREISLRDWKNSDANFYTLLMEGKDKGCNGFAKKYYQREAAWWYVKNARNNYFTSSFSTFAFDKKVLQFKELGMPYMGESISMADIYGTMKPISCGLMVTCNSKGKYGFMNESGKIAIDCIYDKAYSFDDNGLALVRLNGKCGYINTKGQIVVSLTLDNAQPFFYKDHAYCIDGGVLKIINSKGSVVKTIASAKEYHIIEYFRTKEYVALHYTDKGTNKHFWDIYDYNGNLYIEGCTSMNVQVSHGLINMEKDKETVISLDYKW